MLGLTLAHNLIRRGQRVTLIEASPEIGGLTSAWRVGDVVWDRYYHVTLLSDFHLRSLLSDLGLEQDIHWGTTKTKFFDGKSLYPLNNAIDFLRLPVLGLIDKLRLGATIVYADRIENGVPLEQTPVADWLIKLSGRRTFERLWLPLLRSKLGPNHSRVSAAYIWSVIRRFYGARRGGLKTEMFGYVPGGYGRITQTLQRDLQHKGAQVLPGCPVKAITKSGAGIHVTTGDRAFEFDRTVVTFASSMAADICTDLSLSEKAQLRGIEYQGVVCASLLLTRPLGDAYLTYITDESIPFTTVIEMSSLVRPEETAGQYLVYLPRYLPADDPFFDRSDAEIETLFLGGLRRLYPDLRDEEISAFRLSRTRRVLALSTLNYSRNLPAMKTSVPGLWIANSSHIVNGSLSVNESVGLANTVADQLMASLAEDM